MQPHNPMTDPQQPGASMDETGRKIRRFALILAIVLVVGFITVHFIKSYHSSTLDKATDESASAPPLVNVITIGKSPDALALKLPGETAAWYASTIYARVDGYVGKWNVDIGDTVKKGQVLALIETPDLDAQLAASQAKLKAAEALVVARQSDAAFAKTTYDRWRDSPKGVVSEQEREAKKAGHDSAVAQLNEAQAQVALDKADVDRYSVLAKFKQVTAPYDGKIAERHIDIGNLVTAGSTSSTTPLYKIVQNDPMRVFVDAPQSATSDMKVGVVAKITASNIPNHVFEGTITRTADAIDPQARTLRVEVDIPNPDQLLVSGMYVDVAFDVATQGMLQVPAAALVFRSSGPQVAVVDKDKHITFRKITIARDNGNTVELGSGVAVGDTIALNVSNQITEGQTVEISDSKEGTANASASKK
jgi:RND family efflux transporter MFP subunit